MGVFGDLAAKLPGMKAAAVAEHFFALNIGAEDLTAGLWKIENNKATVLSEASEKYAGQEEILDVTDKLLDAVSLNTTVEPSKILFGVPDSWLQDEDLKEPYLKFLKTLIKDLDLTPMAYVATSHALVHFLEKHDGSPLTGILIGIGKKSVVITISRAGKIDGSIALDRGESLGGDVEKGISRVMKGEVLPAKILIYGSGNLEAQKSELTSYPWMSSLSFLHMPKIEIAPGSLELNSIVFAGAVELNPTVKFDSSVEVRRSGIVSHIKEDLPHEEVVSEKKSEDKSDDKIEMSQDEDFGFMAGDVAEESKNEQVEKAEISDILDEEVESNLRFPESPAIPPEPIPLNVKKIKMPAFLSNKMLLAIVIVLIAAIAAYVILPKASVMVYVEPRILEKETQVIASPSIKEVDKDNQQIPGELVDVTISGSGTDQSTGKKQIGDPAKGVVKIINNSNQAQNISKGTVITTPSGFKFTLDTGVNIASTSATSESKSTATANVTAAVIGADSNLPSGTQFTVPSSAQVAVLSEGNFSGGTSKDVTVVSSDDQKRLLASLTADLRKKATEQLQAKLDQEGKGKKVLQETLTEEITKKTYSKNVNDQASSFSLDVNVKYKGTTFNDADLRTIVAKLVETNVPDDFTLSIADSTTESNVSKIDKDGKVTFTAKFKAKLMPKIDTDKIRDQIIGRTPQSASDVIRAYQNVLGADITLTPPLPSFLQRLPILSRNIVVTVGLK